MRVAVTLYDHQFTKIGFADGFEQLTVTVRLNAAGSCSLTLPTSHEHAAKLLTPGVRVVVRATPDDATEFQLFSGPVGKLSASGPGGQATVTAECESDWTILRKVLGWAVPASAITSQSGAEFWTAAGPAETVIKSLITANAVTRLGRPLTVAADGARGADVDASIRFTPLADLVESLAEQGGIGVTVAQGADSLVVDVFEGVDRTGRVLDEANGAVTAWSWATTGPTATRVVAGGPGEGAAREFRTAVDSTRETAERDVIETFVEITDATSGSDLATKAAAALIGMGRTTNLSVELAETASARYGKTLAVGDRLRLQVLGVEVIDVLREATLTFTAAEGPVIASTIGDPLTGTPEKALLKNLGAMAAAIRRNKTR